MSTTFDRARFVKLLALAESDVDGEALAAVRKAASMARAAGLSLGQAVDAGASTNASPSCLPDSVRVNLLEMELDICRNHLAALQDELERTKTNDGSYRRGYDLGYRDGMAAANTAARAAADERVRALEAELEGYREGMDWPAVADRFHTKHRRGARSEYAKGVLYRATTNRLTPEDQAELRRFAEAQDQKGGKRRTKAAA